MTIKAVCESKLWKEKRRAEALPLSQTRSHWDWFVPAWSQSVPPFFWQWTLKLSRTPSVERKGSCLGAKKSFDTWVVSPLDSSVVVAQACHNGCVHTFLCSQTRLWENNVNCCQDGADTSCAKYDEELEAFCLFAVSVAAVVVVRVVVAVVLL